MKVLKKTAVFILCLVLISALLPTPPFSAADGELADGVYYETVGDHAAAIGCADGVTDIVIKSEYNGYPVTEVSGFAGKTDLKSVVLPDSVTTIKNAAFFGCTWLSEITFGSSVLNIGSNAFYDCYKIKKINIPDISKWCASSFADLNSCPFFRTAADLYVNGEKVVDLVIPEGVTSIGKYSFADLNSVHSVSLPKSLTEIGSSAFADCYGLEKVNISDISAWITINFGEYDANPVLYAKNLYLNGEPVKEAVFPEGTKSVGRAFYGCKSLEKVVLPEGVTEIESSAFAYCSALKEINIPKSLTLLGDSAFADCQALTSISLPDGLKTLGKGVFMNCVRLSDIKIPDSVTSIGEFAFSGCTSLTEITVPDGIKTLEDYFVSGCTSLTKVTLPDSIETIGQAAFSGCQSLTEIKLPKNLKNFGFQVFAFCISLTEIEIPEGVETIPYELFASCEKLERVKLPSTLTRIEEAAFNDCPSLKRIGIPDSVEYIHNTAFWNITLETSRGSYTENFAKTHADGYDISLAYHSGGEATCVSGAICESCGLPYGGKDPDNHKHTGTINAVPPTCQQEGYSGDTACLDCGEIISHGTSTGKSDHSYKTERIFPTKDSQGYTLHTCVHCGDNYKDNYTDLIIGDINGDGVVNAKDRLLLSRFLAKWQEAVAEGINEAAADVNSDGKINNLDRLVLARHLAHWEEYKTLPYTK